MTSTGTPVALVKASYDRSLATKPVAIPAFPTETVSPLRFKAVILYVAAVVAVLALKFIPKATSLHTVIN